jgi:hypothetical protein
MAIITLYRLTRFRYTRQFTETQHPEHNESHLYIGKWNYQLKMAVFWVIAPCSLIEIYRRFKGACYLHHQAIVLMMEEASSSETSVNF